MRVDLAPPSPAAGRGAGGEGARPLREGQKIKLARRLRGVANAPEQKAWAALRKLRHHGYPVRRQHPIGAYVVDFAITKERIVIEIDGGIHKLAEVAARDSDRQRTIEALGWTVIRVNADEAMSADHLLRRVQTAIEPSRSAATSSPPAPLPQAGEGGALR
jgi:very-short-patch-repair endonuclease